jgi:ATP-dependent DNA helicase RecG
MVKNISTSIQYLKGVGPKKAKLLSRLGIKTIEDLLYYFPRRYEDRSKFLTISQLKPEENQTIKAKVVVKNLRQSWRRRGFSILEVVFTDKTGKIFCVWFNQPYLKDYFKVGQETILYGKVQEYSGRLQMSSPEFEIVDETDGSCLDIGGIIPVYSLPEGITQRYFRRLIKTSLDACISGIKDIFSYDIRAKYNLLNLAKSLINIHFPESPELKTEAYRRLAFEEFFLFQIPLALRKLRKRENPGIAHKVEGRLIKDFIHGLPFKLTASQEKVISEIRQDMASPRQMQRLLQGDVGSGKTVVATVAAAMAIQGGYQAAFMAPTEILARQHFEKLRAQTLELRDKAEKIKIGLLTGSANKKEKEKIYQEIKDGKIDLIIGTHALLEGRVQFRNLGLVVIDEQHKFGVAQRQLLPGKGVNPDLLIMTATPIPRTLAITLYGDMDISVIEELPPDRKPVTTQLFEENQRQTVYNFIREQIVAGRQAYIIYPIIEESFELDLHAAVQMHGKLKKEVFPGFQVGLIHGRLKPKEQEAVMAGFVAGKINILVATTVLEVGVDVANASVMVIEHAERFGLSQLHQLRGRIGRGPYTSYCILMAQAKTEEAQLRIKAILENNDGFRIAEEDLKIRGPGEFFGKRQHGLSELKIGNPLTQLQLLKIAREEALRLVRFDAGLTQGQNRQIRQVLERRFPGYADYISGG